MGRPSEKLIPILSLLFLIYTFTALPLNGQEGIDQEIKAEEDKLVQIKADIKDFESKLKETGKKEKSLLKSLDDLDREIYLRQKLLKQLRVGKRRIETKIAQKEKEIQNTQERLNLLAINLNMTGKELERLMAIVHKRAIYAYKHGFMGDLELLLTAESVNQAIVRAKYLRLIAQRDKRNILKIKEKKTEIAGLQGGTERQQARLGSQKRDLENGVKKKNANIRETRQEEAKLKRKKTSRKKLLARVRKDKDLLRKELEERKAAAKELEALIVALEKKRLEKAKVVEAGPLLADFRGRLDWPAKGRVVSHFGKSRNWKLNTITENTGIDIKAKLGSPVRAVGPGEVTIITWLRGFGNTVIISHPGGFYTVYSHLGEILCDEKERVGPGQVIGRVGDTGSVDGAKLHFEIWERRQKHNPEKWLKRRG
ncbi:peptidoglycan DD-metalloendopeptidase family protein [candidate division KSB1 bacterium]|nr:peptidoglycan DD-metalloendopeptidase family protein [candidate division KSB1 bacterium]